jgi:hypothetical protein
VPIDHEIWNSLSHPQERTEAGVEHRPMHF